MYLGERVGFSGKVIQAFKDEKGEEHFFKGIKSVYFGDVYEMKNETMSGKPAQVESDWKPTEKDRLEYEAQKIVVRSYRQERQKEMKVKKPHANIARAVELMRPFYIPLSNLDRRRFIAWFENELSKKVKK